MSKSVVARGLYFSFAVLWLAMLLCTLAEPARAYVDPGSGLLAYQVAGSVVTGFLFLLRQQIRRLFRGARHSEEKHDAAR